MLLFPSLAPPLATAQAGAGIHFGRGKAPLPPALRTQGSTRTLGDEPTSPGTPLLSQGSPPKPRARQGRGEFPAAPAEGAEPPGAPRAAPGRGNQGLDGAQGRWHRTIGCSGGTGAPLVLLPLLKQMLNIVKLQLTPRAEQRLQTLCNLPLRVPASQHACSSCAAPGAVPSSELSVPAPRSLPCPRGSSVGAQSLRAAGTGQSSGTALQVPGINPDKWNIFFNCSVPTTCGAVR